MTRHRRHRTHAVARALYVNAALMLALLVAVLLRGGAGPSGTIVPMAFAAEGQAAAGQSIAGGGSIYLMPGQMSLNTFGCYVMDTDAQTLCVYQFYPGDKEFRLVAARNFRFDRRLGNFNTFPDPRAVEEMVELERAARGRQQPVGQQQGGPQPGAPQPGSQPPATPRDNNR